MISLFLVLQILLDAYNRLVNVVGRDQAETALASLRELSGKEEYGTSKRMKEQIGRAIYQGVKNGTVKNSVKSQIISLLKSVKLPQYFVKEIIREFRIEFRGITTDQVNMAYYVNEINVFFDKKNLNLIGWQTEDIYQKLTITFISLITKNQIINKDIFKLPSRD